MADFTEITSILNELRKGQNIDNINELASKHYNWDKQVTQDYLDSAEKEQIIKKYTVNCRISYRLIKDTECIADSEECISTQTEIDNSNDYNNFQAEYIEFKEYVLKELSLLKSVYLCDTNYTALREKYSNMEAEFIALKQFVMDEIYSLKSIFFFFFFLFNPIWDGLFYVR